MQNAKAKFKNKIFFFCSGLKKHCIIYWFLLFTPFIFI